MDSRKHLDAKRGRRDRRLFQPSSLWLLLLLAVIAALAIWWAID